VLFALPTWAMALVIAQDPEDLGASPAGSGTPVSPAPGPSVPSVSPTFVPGPVTVTAKPAKTRVAPGESFVVEVQVRAPSGTRLEFPAQLATDTFELRARSVGPAATASSDPAAAQVRHYDAAVFALAEAAVPALKVKYRLPDGRSGEAASSPIPLQLVSRLPRDADPQKIADIRGPVSLDVKPAFWIAMGTGWIVMGVMFTGALVFLLWLRRRNAAPVVPELPLDPAEEARAALHALAASGLLGHGDHRGFYIALTAIAKRYLERRLKAPVLEMTTAEMVAFLRDTPQATALVGPARDLAGAADQVKFARGQGLTAEAERHTQAVLGMIATLEAALAPPPPAPAQEKVA
jgi:hypothetical protein